MGSLRFLLAISVAYGHLGYFLGFPLVPGDTAVQCFFVVSGFYMSLVLNGKYAQAGYFTFFSNRLLRLYPTYLIVFVLTVALFGWRWPSIDPLGSIYFAVSQIGLFGQDAGIFLHVQNSSLAFTPNFNQTANNLFEYAPVPQAWTLGIELWFYLLAPFIVRQSVPAIISMLIASLAIRLGLQALFGFSGDPWSYRFFPSELALFLLGAIAHRASFKTLATLAIAVGIALIINRPNGISRIASVSFLVLATVSIPWLFAMTSSNKIDRFVGELSYPVYIVHILIAKIIPGAWIALVFVVVAAVALYVLVDRPIDHWRQSRLSKARLAAI